MKLIEGPNTDFKSTSFIVSVTGMELMIIAALLEPRSLSEVNEALSVKGYPHIEAGEDYGLYKDAVSIIDKYNVA